MTTLLAWIGIASGIGLSALGVFLIFKKRLAAESIANSESLQPHEIPFPQDLATVPASQASQMDRMRAPTGLQGNLAQVPVHDFLQFLSQGKRTGILEVISGRRRGYIQMASGHIVHSVFRGRTGLQPLFDLLALKDGDFEFMEGPEAVLPDSVGVGEPHAPLEVLDVLLRWENQMRKSDSSDKVAGTS